jgi:polysaccharide deacetylase 2 family uncharacterized protein YibQ
VNLRPVAVLAAIAALLIGFIYWREHAAMPAKKAPAKVSRTKIAPAKPPRAKKRAAAVTPAPPPAAATAAVPALPPAAKKQKGPVVAIVIDDFGYNMNNVDQFLAIKEPITLSILPGERYTKEVARRARERGDEIILHLPLESWRSDVKEEAVTIRSGMSGPDIDSKLKKELSDLPPVGGVSNHMGSKATEDRKVMTDVIKYLKGNGLYFFDSLTSPRSVCREVASQAGVRYARRDRFLDNDNDPAAIEAKLRDVKKLAIARGRAIAIGHDRKNTAAVLAKTMPEMSREGIEFVYLSEMVE